MAGFYGNNVVNYAKQASVTLGTGAWTALQVSSAPMPGRCFVRIYPKGTVGMAVALAYANRNVDNTFTTPTVGVKDSTVCPGGRVWSEPLSDKVTLYGRLIKKAGVTNNSVPVIVTEFS